MTLLDSDKKFSNFSFTLVTSLFNFYFKSFSSFINFSCFFSYDLVTSEFTFSYKPFILLISFSIISFKLMTFFIYCSNSFDDDSIVKFSFFKDSSSFISNIL